MSGPMHAAHESDDSDPVNCSLKQHCMDAIVDRTPIYSCIGRTQGKKRRPSKSTKRTDRARSAASYLTSSMNACVLSWFCGADGDEDEGAGAVEGEERHAMNAAWHFEQ